jgi:hypothetical protein
MVEILIRLRKTVVFNLPLKLGHRKTAEEPVVPV